MAYKVLVVGVNVYSYLIHKLTGYPVLGRLNTRAPQVFRDPLEDPSDVSELSKIPFIRLVNVRSGVKYGEKIWDRFPDHERLFWEKLGIELPFPLPVGESLYVNVDIKYQPMWYTKENFHSIEPISGGFLVRGEERVYETESLISVLPLRVLARLMGKPFSGKWIYIGQEKVRQDFGDRWHYIYDLDANSPYTRYILSKKQKEEVWMGEIWSTDPNIMNKYKGLRFYSLPIPNAGGPKTHFEGVRLVGPYAMWYPYYSVVSVLKEFG